MTIHPHPSTHADRLVWGKPAAAAIAVLMLLIGPAAVGVLTPTNPGWPASPPTEEPIPPADHPGSDQPAPSDLWCLQPQAATSNLDSVGICGPAGPAATSSPATAATTADPMVL